MATKKRKPKQLNGCSDGVYRDAKKDKKLQMTEWLKKLVNTLKSEKQSGSVKLCAFPVCQLYLLKGSYL